MKYGIKIVGPFFPTPIWVVVNLDKPTKIFAVDDINTAFHEHDNMINRWADYTFQVCEISDEEIQNGPKAYY